MPLRNNPAKTQGWKKTFMVTPRDKSIDHATSQQPSKGIRLE